MHTSRSKYPNPQPSNPHNRQVCQYAVKCNTVQPTHVMVLVR